MEVVLGLSPDKTVKSTGLLFLSFLLSVRKWVYVLLHLVFEDTMKIKNREEKNGRYLVNWGHMVNLVCGER